MNKRRADIVVHEYPVQQGGDGGDIDEALERFPLRPHGPDRGVGGRDSERYKDQYRQPDGPDPESQKFSENGDQAAHVDDIKNGVQERIEKGGNAEIAAAFDHQTQETGAVKQQAQRREHHGDDQEARAEFAGGMQQNFGDRMTIRTGRSCEQGCDHGHRGQGLKGPDEIRMIEVAFRAEDTLGVWGGCYVSCGGHAGFRRRFSNF